MVYDGQFILTEAEPVFDGADTLRFGRDVFITLSHVCIFTWCSYDLNSNVIKDDLATCQLYCQLCCG